MYNTRITQLIKGWIIYHDISQVYLPLFLHIYLWISFDPLNENPRLLQRVFRSSDRERDVQLRSRRDKFAGAG